MPRYPSHISQPMSASKVRFISATVTRLVLAKVGHPQRDEPLQVSRRIYQVDPEDQDTLSPLFLRHFKNLSPHRFNHHASLEHHEMHTSCRKVFGQPENLLEIGHVIAQRLYSKSNHPNIKSGDLCIAWVDDIEVDQQRVAGLCILKSESVVPFISISTRDGDLQLHTEQGINPEKIDKGCLIVNAAEPKGYLVYTFDRSGSDSRFWVRDFLGVLPITDSAFLTRQVADMAVAFVKEERQQQRESAPTDDIPPWETTNAAKQALSFFEEKEHFSMQEFEETVLRDPERVAKFREQRRQVEEEVGQPIEDGFAISKKDLSRAKKHVASVIRLDSGVEIHLKPNANGGDASALERGFDETKGKKFIKVYYESEVTPARSGRKSR